MVGQCLKLKLIAFGPQGMWSINKNVLTDAFAQVDILFLRGLLMRRPQMYEIMICKRSWKYSLSKWFISLRGGLV